MAPEKLLAEWFWIDRWMGSDESVLPLEARGLYREMFTQALRLGGRLPNDHEQIRSLVNATSAEWRRAWPLIERFWRVEEASLVPLNLYGFGRALPPTEPVPHRPWIPMWIKKAVIAIHGNRCAECGSDQRIEFDHVVAYSKGGPHSVENLQPLCKTCNRRKGAK